MRAPVSWRTGRGGAGPAATASLCVHACINLLAHKLSSNDATSSEFGWPEGQHVKVIMKGPCLEEPALG
jgi:hypothetical protein